MIPVLNVTGSLLKGCYVTLRYVTLRCVALRCVALRCVETGSTVNVYCWYLVRLNHRLLVSLPKDTGKCGVKEIAKFSKQR